MTNTSQNTYSLSIRNLQQTDIPMIVEHFARHHWPKPVSTFEKYLHEQEAGFRTIWLAFDDAQFAGYITLAATSLYPPFNEKQIPEIMDLNVLPPFRNKGIGSLLIATAELEAFKKSNIVGIGVGLYKDYGSAQKLYIGRGYQPDGLGLTYDYQTIKPGKTVCLDDDLVLWFTKYRPKAINVAPHQLTTIRSIKNSPHLKWGKECDAWLLKELGHFTVISERMPSNTAEKKHYHNETEQFFYCLSGSLFIELENKTQVLNAHESLAIPAKQIHKIQNISPATTTFLVISSQNSHEDRIDLDSDEIL